MIPHSGCFAIERAWPPSTLTFFWRPRAFPRGSCSCGHGGSVSSFCRSARTDRLPRRQSRDRGPILRRQRFFPVQSRGASRSRTGVVPIAQRDLGLAGEANDVGIGSRVIRSQKDGTRAAPAHRIRCTTSELAFSEVGVVQRPASHRHKAGVASFRPDRWAFMTLLVHLLAL